MVDTATVFPQDSVRYAQTRAIPDRADRRPAKARESAFKVRPSELPAELQPFTKTGSRAGANAISIRIRDRRRWDCTAGRTFRVEIGLINSRIRAIRLSLRG